DQQDQADNQAQNNEQAENQDQQQQDQQAEESKTREYTIKPGDSYGVIAAKELGSRDRYAEIQKLNPGVNPKALKVGQKIKIPAK
ncbi:MAG: LysM peptidoglycan-binding domain-containing protein, partial [Leptospiraceae bacterium]|nr:LysM peptidoglycan-binding domain-containing protein [Leptospiraceae bacterium]